VATGGDEVFRQLVLARLVEPTSKLDSIRVLAELGIGPPGYRTIFRRLLVPLVLYDVTTLYFETDRGDGFREPGFSKTRSTATPPRPRRSSPSSRPSRSRTGCRR
jgi:hypothetical protein